MPPIPENTQEEVDVSESVSVEPQQKESAGPIVGAIIVVFLMIIGAFYFWNERTTRAAAEAPYPSATTTISTTSVQ